MMDTQDPSDVSEDERPRSVRSEGSLSVSPVKSNLSDVKTVIAFASARGGSGKSVLVANLAAALAAKGKKVGILDADTDCPSIQPILGMRRARMFRLGGAIEPAAGPLGLRIIAANMIVEQTAVTPFFAADDTSADLHPIASDTVSVGNGVAHRTIVGDSSDSLARIFEECHFGNLDFLFIDLSSGIDSIRRLARLYVPSVLVLVTPPSQLALDSTRRALSAASELHLPVWGLVENMVGFYCEHCRSVRPLIGEGDASGLSRETGIPILARLPFEPRLADTADRGILFIREHADTSMANQLIELAKRLEGIASAEAKAAPSLVSAAIT